MQLVHYLSTTPNFGDDLNRDIWPALAPGLFADAGDGRGFVGIGTIIGMPDVPDMRLEVFSSGAGYDALAAWRGRDVVYHCVRGPVSARLCGLDPALALTDGAILAPLVPGLPDAAGGGASGGGGIAVVPHFQTLAGGGWAEACAAAGMRLVDPRQNPHAVISALAG
ncbi:MAG TPA: polysaccharide pyruvyl transferase family protein, partial [Novosphingobium sp.]|nr:polysaccharide pyruvyl transferase family protein [Novosphingobium sp.]